MRIPDNFDESARAKKCKNETESTSTQVTFN